MLRVTLADLSRLPPKRLAELLLEWAARDRTLLGRLHGTLSEDARPAEPVVATENNFVEVVGNSTPIRHLAEMIQRFARTDEPVLITGESGTGKELAARALHQRSVRASGPFAAVNCAAIPPNLIASELFGYEKGAFTGAVTRTKGQIEYANGGTLFLDEIGDMPIELQGYLLRFLQEGQIVRVGGRESISVDVRVVAATNVRLRPAIAAGRFREDLYYRLNVLALEIPPLRERQDDIAVLAMHFLREAATQFDRAVTGFAPAAMAVLREYSWPGNVRELRSTIRRAVVIGGTPLVELADLIGLEQTDRVQSAVAESPPMTTQTIIQRPSPGTPEERTVLLSVLASTQENIALTARELGVSRVTLYRMMRRHGVVPSRGFNAPPGVTVGELEDVDGMIPHSHPHISSTR